eukprot:TRINITY_DN7169_c1_g1_i1.p2 TRINITY_DN7169_c1_g1~~TRINITY_DN7169_c1_g1_i1.p2  ORF type:complete len:226 (+),score=21.17 TRINITY_DN7169_c1_g1_i1:160-837(+)
MQITLICASGIRDTGFIGIQDPYVRVKHGHAKGKGQVCKDGGTAPRWNHTLELDYFENQPLVFMIKNSNLLKDDLIGTATMQPDQLNGIRNKGGEGEQITLPVFTQENRQKGEIQVKIAFNNDQRRDTFQSSPNFTAPLQQQYPRQSLGVPESPLSPYAPYQPTLFSCPSNLAPPQPNYYVEQQQRAQQQQQQFQQPQQNYNFYGQQQTQFGQGGSYPRIGYEDQ